MGRSPAGMTAAHDYEKTAVVWRELRDAIQGIRCECSEDEVCRLVAEIASLKDQLRLANIDAANATAEITDLRAALETLYASVCGDSSAPPQLEAMKKAQAALSKSQGGSKWAKRST